MSSKALMAAEGGFIAPGAESFLLPPFVAGITKPMALLVFAGMIVAVFFVVAMRPAAVVPGRLQYTAEMAYGFVRNSIARDMIGSRDYLRFVPYLVALFFFILVNNVFGIIPFIQFPSFSHAGFVYPLAALTWIIYNGVGIGRHGFFGYLKHVSYIPGLPVWIYPMIIPLEFASNVLVRPFTLALRLFANMFAGHLVLLLFALGGEYLLLHSDVIGFKPVGILAMAMGMVLHLLELLIQVLQAYIFTLLTANYIAGAVAEEH